MLEIVKTLLQEGIDEGTIHRVIDTIEEALFDGRGKKETLDQFRDRKASELEKHYNKQYKKADHERAQLKKENELISKKLDYSQKHDKGIESEATKSLKKKQAEGSKKWNELNKKQSRANSKYFDVKDIKNRIEDKKHPENKKSGYDYLDDLKIDGLF